MARSCWFAPFHSGNADPSEIRHLSPVVQDISQIEELISCIEERLADIEHKRPEQIPNTFQTSIKFGNDLLESVLKRVNRLSCKTCYWYKGSATTRRVVIDVLKEVGKTHWLGAGASVLGYVLDQIDQISSNKKECIELLQYMCDLAKRVKQLNEHLPEEKQMFNDVVHSIVEGSLMCLSQMQSHYLFRLFSASVDAGELKSFKDRLDHRYQDLILRAEIDLLDRTPIFPLPSQGEAPDAVGIEEQRDYVIGLLEMDAARPSRRAVVVYGVGGVGKTTLATAVYSLIDLKSYNFCRLDMDENCSGDQLKRLQKQILHDLFDRHIRLKSYEHGREELKKYFRRAKKPVFMFINNVFKGSDLEKLLPADLSCLPKQARILLTTRRLDETSVLLQRGIIERNSYCVKFLPLAQAKQLLCKRALGSADHSFPASVDIDGLVEMCGGIPLILNLIGSKLREHVDDESTCKELVTSLKESLTKGEGEMCEGVVDVVYDSLKEPSQKEAFLDIVFFFNNWPWRIVSYAVGRHNLIALEHAGLVQVCCEGNLKPNTGDPPKWKELKEFVKDVDYQTGIVKVVDAVRARGKKLSNSDRIMDDARSFYEALRHRQKMKGIWLSDKIKCEVEAERFASISSSLRILHFGPAVKANGVCKENFENLSCLIGHDLPVDVNNAKKLAFLVGNVPCDVSQLPSSLRLVELSDTPAELLPGLLENVGNLSSLEELNLKSYFDYSSSPPEMRLPATFGQLQSLRFLDYNFPINLTTLPESFGNLTALEGLSLESCPKLLSLPESFGELKSLRFLKIDGGILTELPENFGKLSSLEELHLGCPLLSLPISFGKLESLRVLELYQCTRELIALPESFGDLFALEELHLSFCPLEGSLPISFGKLKSLRILCLRTSYEKSITLPESFGNLFALEELQLSCSLVSLPVSFGKLKSLRILHLNSCEELIALPEGFADLYSLQELTLHRASKLGSIPDNFGQLTSLKYLCIGGPLNLTTLPEGFGSLSSLENLVLRGCPKLAALPQSFGQLSHLKELYISGSQNMSTLPDQFVQLNSLERLSLISMKSLEKLCDDFECLISLAALALAGCPQLEGKTIDTLVEMKNLTTLNIDGGPMLIERWEQVKDHHTLMVSHNETSTFEMFIARGGYSTFEDGGRLEEIINTALFHHGSSFLHVDVGGELSEWSASSFLSSEAKLALVLTKCDLSSSSNSEALQIVKNKSAELASRGFRVMYVQVGEKNEQFIAQTLPLLSPGTCAWIAPDDKTRQIFAFAVYKLLEPGSHGEFTNSSTRVYKLLKRGSHGYSEPASDDERDAEWEPASDWLYEWDDKWKPWHASHTLIAGTSVSMADDEGKRKVGRWKIIFPEDEESNEFEAIRDATGSFSQSFNSFERDFILVRDFLMK